MQQNILNKPGLTEKISVYLLLAYIFSLGFMQPAFFVLGQRTQLSDLIFIILFIFWLVSFFRPFRPFPHRRFFLLLLFYILAAFLSVCFSVDSRAGWAKMPGNIYLVSLLVITFDLVKTHAALKKVIYTWLAASLFVALIGTVTVILFYVRPDNFINDFSMHHYGTLIPGKYPRIQTTFFYPSMLCNYLSVSLIFLLVAFENSWIGKRIFLVFFLLFSITLFFTLTPGLGGVFLTLGIWFFLVFKKKGNFTLSKTFLITGILLAVLFLLITLVSPVNTDSAPFQIKIPLIEKSVQPSVRLLTWESSLKTFLANPFFGKGLGTNAARVNYLDASGRLQMLTDAHQIFLNVAAQTGVFGLIALILILLKISFLGFSFSIGQSNLQNIKTGLFLAFLSAFLYQGLVGSFEDARHLWVLLGLILFDFGNEDLPEKS